jgi:hypothetical protein
MEMKSGLLLWKVELLFQNASEEQRMTCLLTAGDRNDAVEKAVEILKDPTTVGPPTCELTKAELSHGSSVILLDGELHLCNQFASIPLGDELLETLKAAHESTRQKRAVAAVA